MINTTNGFRANQVPIHILCDADLTNHENRKRRSAYRSYRDQVNVFDLAEQSYAEIVNQSI